MEVAMSDDVGEDLVNCTICLEHFVQPKTLICLHTFCEACLRSHLASYLSQRRDLVYPLRLPCPTCREVTMLQENGISGLKTDFKIAKITEVLSKVNSKVKLCDVCMTVKKESRSTHHCKECNKYFCGECVYRHKNTVLFEGHAVQVVGSKANNLCSTHKTETLQYFCQSCASSCCTLCAMTDHMMHTLEELNVGRARHERQQKLQGLLTDLDQKIQQVDSFLKLMDSYENKLRLSYETTVDAIKVRADDLVKHIRDEEKELSQTLLQQYEGKIDHIVTERHNITVFSSSLKELRTEAQSFLPTDQADPASPAASANQSEAPISPELVSRIRAAAQVPFLNPEDFSSVKSSFELTFPLETPCLGHLKEECISSNLSFILRVPVQLVTRVNSSKLDWPSDVALMGGGRIVVADTENYQLKVFSPEGKFLSAIGVGEIKPAGVVATAVSTIAVTDILDRCVKIYSEDGVLLYEFGHSMFHSPAGIAVNGLGQYIVTDIGKGCVTVHNSQGDIMATLSSGGDNRFDGPWYVATNDQNDIIVSDMGNHCIKIYNHDYQLQSRIEDPEGVMCPNGVSVDIQGNILVCDNGRNTISMYTPDGQFISHVLVEEDGIDCPHGIAVNDSGRVALTLCGTKTSVAEHELRLYQLYDWDGLV